MGPLGLLLVVSQILTFVCGKHIATTHQSSKRKAYPRQMIIPNKFIPMLKGSALFKSRSSTNDLSDFLKPKSHEAVTGQTRQNLMSAIGMDAGASQGEDAMGPGGMGQGGTMPALGGMGAMGGAMGGGGGLDGLGKMGGGMGGLGGMNDQMNAMNGLGGMSNSVGGGSPLEGQLPGNNGMNPMSNVGPDGMMSNSNSLPAGDPMGTLKAMLDNQGTNAALGSNTEAFGPGGSANANVLAMLNQIVGKEMPGDSPVEPGSRSQQMWDQIQKGLNNQRAAEQPYMDSSESRSTPGPAQNDAPSNPTPANTTASPTNTIAPASSEQTSQSTGTPKTPVYNLTVLKTSSSSHQDPETTNQPNGDTANGVTVPTASSTSTKSNTNTHTQADSQQRDTTKATSSPVEMDLDDDQPIPDDMVKFLKGIKFVVSQEPGNDIILGKKFTSGLAPASAHFKEENGVMKNIVSEKRTKGKRKNMFFWLKKNKQGLDENAMVKDLKGINLSYARKLLRGNVNSEELPEYQKAARVLERASRKLTDPIAKKSTEIAIASILHVLSLRNKEKVTPPPIVDPLIVRDVKNALSERYFEAARVLGTASKKLADPVAKKSAEIGIAAILKVIALGNYDMSKKNLIPLTYYRSGVAGKHFNVPGRNQKRNGVAANEIAHKLLMTLKVDRRIMTNSGRF